MALTEAEERLLWRYHDYLRSCGFAVCARKTSVVGRLGTWAPVGMAGERGGKHLVGHFARWLEQQDQSSVVSRESSEEEEDGA